MRAACSVVKHSQRRHNEHHLLSKGKEAMMCNECYNSVLMLSKCFTRLMGVANMMITFCEKSNQIYMIIFDD